MIEIKEYVFKLEGLANNLNKELLAKVSAQGKATENLTLDVVERVRDTGKSFDGSSFTPYSAGYKKQRQKKGRSINFKNFEMTTQMWKDFGVKEKKIDETGITIVQKGSSEQYKIDFQSEYEKKSIIAPSQKEIDKWWEDVNEEFMKLLGNIK